MRKQVLYLFILIANSSILFSHDVGTLSGTFTSSFPYPFRFIILNDDEIKLEWTNPPDDHRYDQSKIFRYDLSKEEVFLQIMLDEDVPSNLWEAITGNMMPWNVGDLLFGLFSVIEDGERAGGIIGVTYSADIFQGSNVFTVDVPNYEFDGPAHISPFYAVNPSSELKEGDITYSLSNLYTVDSGKSWVEGSYGNGVGESFELEFHETPQYLAVMNGFISVSNPSLYFENGRIKTIRIEGLTTGIVLEREIEDFPNLQTIDIHDLSGEAHAKITIVDVYPGELYLDTCLHFMSYSEYAIHPLSCLGLK